MDTKVTTRGHWIDGRSVPSASGETFDVLDPGNEQLLCRAARGGAADVGHAVASARRAAGRGEWGGSNHHTRARLLLKLSDLIRREKDSLAEILALENGKPLALAHHEVGSASSYCESAAGYADKLDGRQIDTPGGATVFTLREPYGVVAQISPWNYPLDILMRGAAPALATGNTVVAKPAEDTPSVAVEIARLATEAGFPAGVFNVVLGLGAEAGAALSSSTGIDAITFCGSPATGAAVASAASKNLVPVLSLELGGKTACLVLQDGDVDRAARSCAGGMIYNAGQSCIARSRLIVHESQIDRVRSVFREAWAKVRLGHSLSGADMGPVINRRQRDKLVLQLAQAREQGATIDLGGVVPDSPDLARGWFITPALLTNVERDMHIAREEAFGPVQCVMTYKTEDEGFEIANDTPFGLSAELWTTGLANAMKGARLLRSGQVAINNPGWCGSGVPFGGVGRSGFGREGGREGMEAYTCIKSVMIGN